MILLQRRFSFSQALPPANDNCRLRLVVNKVLREEGTGGNPTDYIYLNGRPLAMLTGTTFTYLHGNTLGAPQVATSASQTVIWKASYQPFNTVIATSGTATINLRMPGQYYDAESGLAHNGARDYASVLGRYVEPDPIGLAGGINTYSYASNRPMDLSDPMGLSDWNMFNPSTDPSLYGHGAEYNPPNVFSITGHGLNYGMFDENQPGLGGGTVITGQDFLNQLYANGYQNGTTIVLMAYSTGAGGINSFAQWVAEQTGGDVIGADDQVMIGSDPNNTYGMFDQVQNGGHFWEFHPNPTINPPTKLKDSYY